VSWEFRVWSLEFGVWSLEFGVWSLEFGVWSLEFGVWSLSSYYFLNLYAILLYAHQSFVLFEGAKSTKNTLFS
jgi:hypothetical protein